MPLDISKLKHFKFPSLTSTNTIGAELAKGGVALASLRADVQTAGRTTKAGERWISEPGDLFYTFIFKMPASIEPHFSNLSLLSAIAVIRTLVGINVALDLSIKWPNDILLSGKKLAGILIEKEGKSAIVGIGMNIVNTPPPRATTWPATSLLANGVEAKPKDIANALEKELVELINALEVEGFDYILRISREYLYKLGETVRLESLGKLYFGTFEGIAPGGAIIINIDGQRREFLSGNLKA